MFLKLYLKQIKVCRVFLLLFASLSYFVFCLCVHFFFLSLEDLDKIVTTRHNHSNSVHRVMGSLALVKNNNVSLSKRTCKL